MKIAKNMRKHVVTAVIAITGLGVGYGMSSNVRTAPQPQPVVSVTNDIKVPMVPASFSELAERIRPGVVNIQVIKKVQNAGFAYPDFPGFPFGENSPFGPFFEGNPPMDRMQEGTGSGFIIDREGYIITNNHVVEDADRIQVKLANGKEYDAEVVGLDPKTDLALIKISGAEGLQSLILGNSEDLEVGSWVVAIGSPFGLEQTVTQGIVSGKGRVIGSGPYDDFIQTDASINPGNSGGPLVNMNGEVVGINTAMYPNGQGIGFAIPVDMAKNIIPQLEEKGSVTRGWLGVGIQELTPALEKSFRLKDKEGLLVADVFKDSPAEIAGILTGDIITRFDGKSVSEAKDLSRVVASTPVGKTVAVTLIRDGKAIERSVKLGEMEDPAKMASLPLKKNPLGITAQELTPEIASSLGVDTNEGVVVRGVEPGSPAADAGIRTGDVIREVNRSPVESVGDFSRKMEKAKSGDHILMRIQRGGNSLFTAITNS
ncbi:MAG: DegQ family serine endoprotease [Acidobacteriota bacterium]|jgi:serine protease Do